MNELRLPVLREDSSTLDWIEATYEVNVQYRGISSSITVEHIFNNAEPLLHLIDKKECQWATEVRCPRTLFSRVYLSETPHQEVTWDEADVIWENTFIVCGLVATSPTQMRSEGLNQRVWPSGTLINIPQGWWLTLSDLMQLNPLLSSLLKFARDDQLLDGQMRVEEDTSTTAPRFTVYLAADIHSELRDRPDLQRAGLISAFSCMPKSTMRKDEERAEHPVTQEIRNRLAEANVDNWDEEEFDPALAATVIEKFRPLGSHTQREEQDEEQE